MVSNPQIFLANIYLFKVNNRNNRKRLEISWKLTIKLPEWCHWGDFIVNFEHISHLILLFLLLTLNKSMLARLVRKQTLKHKPFELQFHDSHLIPLWTLNICIKIFLLLTLNKHSPVFFSMNIHAQKLNKHSSHQVLKKHK